MNGDAIQHALGILVAAVAMQPLHPSSAWSISGASSALKRLVLKQSRDTLDPTNSVMHTYMQLPDPLQQAAMLGWAGLQCLGDARVTTAHAMMETASWLRLPGQSQRYVALLVNRTGLLLLKCLSK